ncbi:MarR family transcriptional regulator [Streptomyces omiyaensis]|uniref:MarR family transcriptional regulator n=1 Tax=Streptomyces omiyaensis TaxID=68247 RepID=A0ABW7C0D0_9ACTN
MGRSVDRSGWTFLTSHARVLLAIAADPGIRLRDVAARCDVTERTVQGIVADLEQAKYLTRQRARDGRRNQYRVDTTAPFRHPAEEGHEIAELITLFTPLPAPPPADQPHRLGRATRDGSGPAPEPRRQSPSASASTPHARP